MKFKLQNAIKRLLNKRKKESPKKGAKPFLGGIIKNIKP
jgi:hypothetical protein